MIASLHIENMAIISALDVDFGGGLSAITGETGAGKSVLIDCVLFLLGGKPTRDLLRHGTDKGLVSAVFTDIGRGAREYLTDNGFTPGEELLLQRTLTADGKTAARLDGRMIPQAMLRALGRHLVSVHGQNDNQLLLDGTAQARVLDGVADFGGMLDAYRETYRLWRAAEARLAETEREGAEKLRLADILRFQIAEIDEAVLQVGEEEALVARRALLQNSERIAKQTGFTYHVLKGSEKGAAALIFERAAAAMQSVSGVLPEAEALAARLTSLRYEVLDIAETVADILEGADENPTAALDAVEARLDRISKLERKYGADIAAVLAHRAQAAEKLELLDNAEEIAHRLRAEIKAHKAELSRLATLCHAARVQAAKELDARIATELSFLDMPAVRFEISVRDTGVYGADGVDEIVFMISTNKGEAMMPLSRVASGGELSRVMLALRTVLSDRDGVGTAIFDEVDTGISGKTARKIGIKLTEIGRETQVISVTHSAQIASMATAHYKIAKQETAGRTVSTAAPLDYEGRVAEVARILSGLSVTDASREAAIEMIREGEALRT
ncbi:MAG: DNA repair protein RecN [Clostridia bacterium]|nr:DNA repair protein RecN [Clostridia bacterium]